MKYEYIAVIDATGEEVGLGPDEDREMIERDVRAWNHDGYETSLKRRPISPWEDA